MNGLWTSDPLLPRQETTYEHSDILKFSDFDKKHDQKSMTKKFFEHELLGKHLGGPLYGANRQILVEVTVFQCFWETGSTSGDDRKLKTSPSNSPYTN